MKTLGKVFVTLSILLVIAGCGDGNRTAAEPTQSQAQAAPAQQPQAKAEPFEVKLEVSPLRMDCVNFPVRTNVRLPQAYAQVPDEQIGVTLTQQSTNVTVPGQMIKSRRGGQIWWIIPKAGAGETTTWVAKISPTDKAADKSFNWQDTAGDHLDLFYNGRKVISYLYPFDDSTQESFRRTTTPFYHVYDENGEKLLTNGTDPNALYPHHRGIFIGWQKTQFKDKTYNFWAMQRKGGPVQKHQRFLGMTAGAVLARANALINWNTPEGETVIEERRQVTAFPQGDSGVCLLQVMTALRAVNGDVFFAGDRKNGPEHSGLHYRAHNDVNTGPNEVKAVYTFPSDDINAETDENFPWAAMSYGLNGKRYHVQFMDDPRNPRPTYFSAYRDYGRFGPAFLNYTIKAGESVRLTYYIWVTTGQAPTRAKMDAMYWSLVNSPQIKIVQ